MGCCCSKVQSESTEAYGIPLEVISTNSRAEEPPDSDSEEDREQIDRFIMELLHMIAAFAENDNRFEEYPTALRKLLTVAKQDEGWYDVVTTMIKLIPVSNPLGPATISVFFELCQPLSNEKVLRLQQMYGLSALRSLGGELNMQVERNINVVLGCIAERFAETCRAAVLTEETLDYMLSFLIYRRTEPRIVLYALVALEKFARTKANKVAIKNRLIQGDNPLICLERYWNSVDYPWRQVGFCAKWALDNLFTVARRPLSFQTADMDHINVIINTEDMSAFLKLSFDGLEVRNDTYSFESIRSTFQINHGVWYYEAMIMTPGIMQIGWATTNSHFFNHDGFGIGDDIYSVSYDGCRKVVWYRDTPEMLHGVVRWWPGDIIGCLIDMDNDEAVFYHNGRHIKTCCSLLEMARVNRVDVTRDGCGYYPAASIMAHQQCRFNFGAEPFQYPPRDRNYLNMNKNSNLSPGKKLILPRHLTMRTLLRATVAESTVCTNCLDNEGVVLPCGHRGFCLACTSQLNKNDCQMCRDIQEKNA